MRAEPDGVTASEVAERFALHPNVARHHLDKLAGGGYLEVRTGRAGGGAGRPSKRYAPGDRPMTMEFPLRNDDLVLSLLRPGELIVAITAQCATQGMALQAQAQQLQHDLQKIMRRFGRQCRGILEKSSVMLLDRFEPMRQVGG